MEINKIIEEMREYLCSFVDSYEFRECLILQRRYRNDNKLSMYEHVKFCVDLSVHHDKIYDYLRTYLKKLGKKEINNILYLFGQFYSENITIECLQILIDNGADVNTKDFEHTILSRYLNRAHWTGSEFINLLLKNGADVNMIDKYSKIPLEYYLMFFNGYSINLSTDVIMLLLDAGTNYKSVDYKQYHMSQTNEELYLDCIGIYEARNKKPAKK